MTPKEQKAAAKKFVETWTGKGYEKGESQKFWIDLLSNVFGIKDFSDFIYFENQIKDKIADKTITNFIDAYIPSTKVMIEQKSSSKNLREPIRQSDGSLLNPFQQAKKYISGLPVSQHPRWIITCNFSEFLIYDMENPNGEPEELKLENLEKELYRLSFITDVKSEHLQKEVEISKKAGDIIGLIYDKLLEQYKKAKNVDMEKCLKSLNMLCVRLVFCFYAEDADIFPKHLMFTDYINSYESKDLRSAILNLFKILDQKDGSNGTENERDPFLDENLAAFPYVNGGLFTEEDQLIPQFTDELKDLMVNQAGKNFNWSEISPTIFGAVFESTLNPETRRSGGMHYTSIENIHKVIDPLFLDDLKAEFEEIKQIKQANVRISKMKEFHKKLGTLKFLDPACGSGNFLTETYLSLRRLGNECIKVELGIGEGELNLAYNAEDLIQVSIHQFYGIEINDFAAVVAKTALWIAESQMMSETAKIIDKEMNFLPLKSYANIVEGNALRIDWETVCPKNELNYIMGNPPFSGTRVMSEKQKSDISYTFGKKWNSANSLDYVACWYKKAVDFIKNSKIQCAFVSTNSIVQGEQVSALWKPLFIDYKIQFNFAYQTFIWDSEANIKAHVHCVIIGFSSEDFNKEKKIYLNDKQYINAKNINAYLNSADNIFIEKQSKPICDVPEIFLGCTFNDNNNLILEKSEKDLFLKKYPEFEKYIRPYVMGKDFIDRKPRYCFWLKNISPSILKKCPELMNRIEKVKAFRSTCKNDNTLETANTPTMPSMLRYYAHEYDSDFIAIPKVSSQRRRYIPMELLPSNYVAGDKIFLMPKSNIYTFGVMTSNVHMAWMRVLCGRLKSDYSYSSTIVYNTFPFPNSTSEQKAKIEQTAQAILDARAKYPDCSLADLYDETVMPPELRKAHQDNDRAVMAAYGFFTKMTESECVAELFKLYEKLVTQQELR